MNQALVQDVVAEVMRRLSTSGSGGRPATRAGEDAPANEPSFRPAHRAADLVGQFGVFNSVDDAVVAASEAQEKLAKAATKASARSVAATPQQSADEKQQAAALGLNGDTAKHKKKKVKEEKHKHVKGEPKEPKERLQEKTKPQETAQPPAPTVNPALGSTPAPKATISSARGTLKPKSPPAA